MKPNPRLIQLVSALLLASPLCAQETPPKLSPDELAARRQSVINLEAHIDQRDERLGEIVADIRSLDDRVEDGVTEIVTMMSQVTDSESSKVSISNTKADIIVALKRTIEYYTTHRDTLREQLRSGKSALPKETLEKDLAVFDTRVEQRVGQIIELAKSFPDPKELEKYETTSVAGWNGWNYANEVSEAWKQNPRDSRHTDSAREGVRNGLLDSIAHFEQRNNYLAEKMTSANVPDAEREYYRSEISRNNGIIEQRNTELQQFSSGGTTAAAAPVKQDQAHDLDQLVQSSRKDLREDFLAIFRKYAELNRARAELKQLQDNLVARKEWLVNYDAVYPQ